MSGLGRRTHYRKHLTDSIIYDFPEPGENECVAKVVATRGSNQFDIILPNDNVVDDDNQQPARESHLAILPTKFNKLVWVKRNDFVIVDTAADDENNATDTGSIRYIISHILYKEQVKHLQAKGMWPKVDAEFATERMGLSEQDVEDEDDHDKNADNNDGIVYDVGSDDDDLFVNTNRIAALKVDDSSEEESSDEMG
jgi:probable RNA-binding protein EIF1AD